MSLQQRGIGGLESLCSRFTRHCTRTLPIGLAMVVRFTRHRGSWRPERHTVRQVEGCRFGEPEFDDPWMLLVSSTVADRDRAPGGTFKILTAAPADLAGGADGKISDLGTASTCSRWPPGMCRVWIHTTSQQCDTRRRRAWPRAAPAILAVPAMEVSSSRLGATWFQGCSGGRARSTACSTPVRWRTPADRFRDGQAGMRLARCCPRWVSIPRR